jgi:hypothetical protein
MEIKGLWPISCRKSHLIKLQLLVNQFLRQENIMMAEALKRSFHGMPKKVGATFLLNLSQLEGKHGL